MALHMMMDRIRPEEPSSAPATIEQVVIEGETHGAGGKAGVGIQNRDHGGHVGAADGDDEQHAEQQGQAAKIGKQEGVGRDHDQAHRQAQRDGEQGEVDGVLITVGDGPLRQDLLQFAHGHEAAGEGEEAEQRFDHQRDHHDVQLRGGVGWR